MDGCQCYCYRFRGLHDDICLRVPETPVRYDHRLTGKEARRNVCGPCADALEADTDVIIEERGGRTGAYERVGPVRVLKTRDKTQDPTTPERTRTR